MFKLMLKTLKEYFEQTKENEREDYFISLGFDQNGLTQHTIDTVDGLEITGA